MQSSLHGMIDKAHRYAEEPDRVQLSRLEALVGEAGIGDGGLAEQFLQAVLVA